MCFYEKIFSGIAYIQYSHPSCAAYAKNKLNGFEYPPGFRISVRYPPGDSYGGGFPWVNSPINKQSQKSILKDHCMYSKKKEIRERI